MARQDENAINDILGWPGNRYFGHTNGEKRCVTTQGHYYWDLKFGFAPFRKFERVEACSACVEVDSSRDSVYDWQCGNLDHVDMTFMINSGC